MNRPLISISFVLWVWSASQVLLAQEKKDLPVIKVVTPIAVIPGAMTPLTIRGFKLAEATEIRFLDLKSPPILNVKSKGAAKPPDKVAPEKVGDSQVELELTLPADTPLGMLRFIAISPQGQSEPQQIVVLDPAKIVAEKEPNDGFSSAQELQLGQSAVGTLLPGQNVDVFRFSGKAGQKITIEVQAARLGSLLDPFLMLHNSQGQLLAEIDDDPTGIDPVLEATLPADGVYFLSLLDAHDKESPVHVYIVSLK